MKQIAAIALLALRNTFRSRVILVLSALLFAAAFLLPLGIRGDGTPEGLIRIHLAYTLGISAFLLSLATLWAGCAAISQEADDKTLQLLLVKPVSRCRIWFGKWLALLLMNALLLALVGGVSALALRHHLRRGNFDPDAMGKARQTTLAALATLRAPLPDITAEVRAEYNDLRARGALPPNVREATVLDALRRARLARLYSIAPAADRTWTFSLSRAPGYRGPRTLIVQYKCDSSVPGAADIRATLDLRLDGQAYSRDIDAMPGTIQSLVFTNLPAGAAHADVVFRNHGAHGATLFFDPVEGLVVREPAGTFRGNYLRALLRLFVRLALFAAIGTTLGTLFSMPVAAFLALVLILILQLSGFITSAAQVDRATFVANVAPFGAGGHDHGDAAPVEAGPSRLARATATVLYYAYRGTYLTLRPLLEDRTLEHLSAGTHLPLRPLVRDALQQAALLPLLLALVATLVLRRREWALPQLN